MKGKNQLKRLERFVSELSIENGKGADSRRKFLKDLALIYGNDAQKQQVHNGTFEPDPQYLALTDAEIMKSLDETLERIYSTKKAPPGK